MYGQALDILLKAGADLDRATDQLFTPLHIAAYNGKTQLVKRLIGAGAKIDAKSKQSYTAAGIAAQRGHVELLAYLVER